MTLMAVVLTIIAITSVTGKAINFESIKEEFPDEVSSEILGICPPTGTADVTLIGASPSLIVGHATIDPQYIGEMRQIFKMWLMSATPRPHGRSRVQHYHFYCDSKSLPEPNTSNKGPSYVRMYGRDINHLDTTDLICSLFEVVNKNATMFRMAISGDSSCGGLSDIFINPRLLTTESHSDCMLLMLNKPLIPLPTKKNFTESKESTATNKSEIQDNDGGRVKRHSLIEMSSGDEDRNLFMDASTPKTEDTDKIRQPLSIEPTQQPNSKRKRSSCCYQPPWWFG